MAGSLDVRSPRTTPRRASPGFRAHCLPAPLGCGEPAWSRPVALRSTLTVVLTVSLVLLAGLLAPAPAVATTLGTSPTRAAWVWHRTPFADLMTLVDREGVTDLFVQVPGDLAGSEDLAWFQRLRARATTHHVRLHALGGELPWLEDPDAALIWQRQALATGLFDGVHLDVEPWQRRTWDVEHDVLLRRLVRLLGTMTTDTELPVEADIPFWLDRYDADGVPVDRAVMAVVDAVTVMSYRDTVTVPDSVTGVGAPALASAEATGTAVRLAVETHDLGPGPVADKQTWFGETRTRVRRALDRVDALAAEGTTYLGTAVHDSDGWQGLPRHGGSAKRSTVEGWKGR